MKEDNKSNAWNVGWGWKVLIPILTIAAIFTNAQKDNICKTSHDNDHISPLDILKERYAKGEIDKAEYFEKLKDIL
jgi:putative membrane protein